MYCIAGMGLPNGTTDALGLPNGTAPTFDGSSPADIHEMIYSYLFIADASNDIDDEWWINWWAMRKVYFCAVLLLAPTDSSLVSDPIKNPFIDFIEKKIYILLASTASAAWIHESQILIIIILSVWRYLLIHTSTCLRPILYKINLRSKSEYFLVFVIFLGSAPIHWLPRYLYSPLNTSSHHFRLVHSISRRLLTWHRNWCHFSARASATALRSAVSLYKRPTHRGTWSMCVLNCSFSSRIVSFVAWIHPATQRHHFVSYPSAYRSRTAILAVDESEMNHLFLAAITLHFIDSFIERL